ncbi:molybdenum cofactor guanylyltransferase MobA [Inhella gelatinilytica]|uniref:molybdenum cofactor guanylyltransferase MobA n=1 Tax=Inhella gelatinilytica TaxID=2795030 RepID=UPI0028732320|nr:molybdenum cofactor guanylyltransferase MobA [Inhella gelatinilytica]
MADTGRLAAVVLAGGEGRRMGGQDKGLLLWQGQPLVDAVLARIRAQEAIRFSALALSANRHLDVYATRGLPVLPDAPAHVGCGPLAGLREALRFAQAQGCEAVWVLPCDAPRMPLDLARRLRAALGPGASAAVPVLEGEAGEPRWQPAHALLTVDTLAALDAALAQGERRVMGWLRSLDPVAVPYPPTAAPAFANLNRPEDLI